MKNMLLVFIGSGLGGIVRYAIRFLPIPVQFPYGTLVVNVIASFILGILVSLSASLIHTENTIKHLLIIGFCGGLSTFSTFSYESLNLFQKNIWEGLFYILTSVIMCITFVLLGVSIKFGTFEV